MAKPAVRSLKVSFVLPSTDASPLAADPNQKPVSQAKRRSSSAFTDSMVSTLKVPLKKPRLSEKEPSHSLTPLRGKESRPSHSSASETTQDPLPRKNKSATLSRIEIVKKSLSTAGYSAAVAARMAGAVRPSTARLYQSKWSIFTAWCGRRHVEPLSVSLPVIADFLLFLRDEKRFTVPTIKGYRSALALALKPHGIDISSSVDLTALVRSFSLEKPIREIRPPSWDLSVVLSSFLVHPYEPLDEAPMMLLSHKAAFLLALASAKRVSEIQAFLGSVLHKEDWSSVTLQLDPGFLAKTQISYDSSSSSSMVIPALSRSVGSEEEDLKLCPVRAIRTYLRRTRKLRGKNDRLFLPVIGKKSFVSKNTISRWISSAIKRAYASISEEHRTLHSVKAHEVRAIATSWHFAHNQSLEAVMSAASWRGHSTFSSFYMRDVSLMKEDVHTLGPVVAALAIVDPPHTDKAPRSASVEGRHDRHPQKQRATTTVPASAVCHVRRGGDVR